MSQCNFKALSFPLHQAGAVNWDLLGNVQLSLFLGDASFDALDLRGAEAGKGSLVLWTSEVRTDRTFELRDWSSSGWPAFSGSAGGSTGGGLGARHDCEG